MNEIDRLRAKCDALEDYIELLQAESSSDRIGSIRKHLDRVAVRDARVASYTAVTIRDRVYGALDNEMAGEAHALIKSIALELEHAAQRRQAEYAAQHHQVEEQES